MNGKYYVRDMSSSTGTFIKLPCDTLHQFQCGDVFQAGNTEFTVMGIETNGDDEGDCCCVVL